MRLERSLWTIMFADDTVFMDVVKKDMQRVGVVTQEITGDSYYCIMFVLL